MTQIRNNNASFAAAAVSDTAGVAASRGPLHPASQGPLAPTAAVFDTAAVARRVAVSDTASVARRVTVSDTVTVIPCLKKTLKYSTPMAQAQVQSILREIASYDNLDVFETSVDAALVKLQKRDKELFKKVGGVNKFSNRREALENALSEYAVGNTVAWETQWGAVKASFNNKEGFRNQRTDKVKAYNHNDNFQSVAKESRTTMVSFDTVTVKEYVLTKEDRLHKLSKKKQLRQRNRVWVPSTEYKRHQALPADMMNVGMFTARVLDSSVADSIHKQWIANGNKEALELDQQSLPEATQSTVSDTTVVHATTASTSVTETVAQSTQSPVVSDTTVVQSTQNVVLETTIQPSVVSDTTAGQSTPSDVVDTSMATRGRVRQSSVVSDTAAVQSTPSDVIDTSMVTRVRGRVRQASVVSDTTAVQPLRRSARIAAANASTAAPVRRTTRKGAVKPKGFYKV